MTENETEPLTSDSKRFAIYDNRYLRFLPGTYTSRPTKTDAKDAAGHDDVEIREV